MRFLLYTYRIRIGNGDAPDEVVLNGVPNDVLNDGEQAGEAAMWRWINFLDTIGQRKGLRMIYVNSKMMQLTLLNTLLEVRLHGAVACGVWLWV